MNKQLNKGGKSTVYLIIPQIGLIPCPQNLWVCNIAKIQETNLHQIAPNGHSPQNILLFIRLSKDKQKKQNAHNSKAQTGTL
jgi:hypothetical protein